MRLRYRFRVDCKRRGDYPQRQDCEEIAGSHTGSSEGTSQECPRRGTENSVPVRCPERSGRHLESVSRTPRSFFAADKDAPACDTTSGREGGLSRGDRFAPARHRDGSGPRKLPAVRTVRDHPGCGRARAGAQQAPEESVSARQDAPGIVRECALIPLSVRRPAPLLTPHLLGMPRSAWPLLHGVLKPTYEAGLRRDAVQPDIEAERKKRDEIEAGKRYCSGRFGGATCDDKSAQIYARFDKNDWRIQPAEFYRFHDAEVNALGYF